MKLKRMEINGFKSFCEKASIVFPPGVSAIVGPNGCGKSNIVDALKWAMGEQSVKQLRGKAMEDVIFAGTNGKPPSDMAEVSLRLSKDNGDMPEEYKDFSEIIITRRLRRSGESAYLINKQPCRLKDIHNIFLGSGMGARSYSIIQQGNIGAITEAGPEERRYFIEEAAGITRYKKRKNEALRKVDATNQNLLRIKDVVAEVERQMNSLKRQAQKAERYKKHKEIIRRLEILLAFHEFDAYSKKIQESAALLKSLKDEDVGQFSQIKELDAAVETIKIERWQKDQEISKQKTDKFETQRKIDKAENELAHLTKDVGRLDKETSELQAAYAILKEKNETIGTEIAEAETENTSLTTEIEQIKSELSHERLNSQSISDKLTALNQELEEAKTTLMNLTAQEAKYKNICQTASNNKESIKRRLRRIDEEEAIANQKVAESEKKEISAKEELDLLKQEIEELNTEISSIRRQIDEKNRELAEQVKQVQSLDMERNKIKSKYSTLKKMADNMDWYKEGVKAILGSQNLGVRSQGSGVRSQGSEVSQELTAKNQEPGANLQQPTAILGLVADIIEPEPSFEVAVEAVLGEAIQYILVQDQEKGMNAISYLQTQGAGRGGFIPISSLNSPDSPKKNAMKNGNDLLLNHVVIKSGFEKIAQTLLDHVIIAENMPEAIDIFRKNGSLKTIVTRDGNMVSSQGILIGGSKENLSGILSKKQELRELESQLADVEEQLKSARELHKKLDAEVRSLENELQRLTQRKHHLAYEEMESEKALYKASEELKHARRHLELIQMEQDQLLDEENGIDDEMEQSNRSLKEIENEVTAIQEKIGNLSKESESVSLEMESFNQKHVDLKLKLTALNAKWENSNHTLRRLREFQEDGMTRFEQLSQDIILKSKKHSVSKEKIAEYEQSLSVMYEKMKQLDEFLKTNEAEFQSIDAQLKENDKSISDIQTRREEILQKIRMLELEQSRRQLKQENIANQIEERYHKPLIEFRDEFKNEIASESKSGEAEKMDIKAMQEDLVQVRKKLENIGNVNLEAISEYEEQKERFDFLCKQRDDLVNAIDDLHKVIKKINKITQERFLDTFNLINEKLNQVFPRLFDGGSASLVLTEPDKPLETGVEFMVHPPGKRLTRLSLLSGGEKALSAIAFIFSIFLIKPTAFCIMDEIDAPLDEANVFRFNELLKIIGEKSQIILITHKKRSMEFADTLFGVTMEKKGISKIVSVNFG